MTLLNPAGLNLLLLIPVIVLLHLFRRERRRRTVSSILLWQQIRDQSSRRLRPQLLKSLNLLLQLIAVIVAALALSDPILTTATIAGPRRLILMVDRSASMGVREEGLRRLELAANRARERISASPRDTQLMLVSVGRTPRIEQTFTTDRARVLEALREITSTDESVDIVAAFSLAAGLGSESEDTGVALFTDGAFDVAGDAAPSELELYWVGSERANLAITAMQLRRAVGDTQVYLEIANFGAEAREVELQLSVDGSLRRRDLVQISGGESQSAAFSIGQESATIVSAELADTDDALASDDRATVVLDSPTPTRVQLVTEGNFFLQTALEVLPEVTVSVSEQYEAESASDVVVFDSVQAPTVQSGSVFVVNTAIQDGPFRAGESQPTSGGLTLRESPLTAGVQLDAVEVLRVLGGTLAQGVSVHALRGNLPVLYSYQTETLRLVGLNVSTAETDLALSPAFPVLISNVISWLSTARSGSVIAAHPTGEPFDLFVPIGREFEVETPAGEVQTRVATSNPVRFRGSEQAGIYTLRSGPRSSYRAASVISASESNLAPRFLPMQAREPGGEGDEATGRPMWRLALALLLALLVADWFIWTRRT